MRVTFGGFWSWKANGSEGVFAGNSIQPAARVVSKDAAALVAAASRGRQFQGESAKRGAESGISRRLDRTRQVEVIRRIVERVGYDGAARQFPSGSARPNFRRGRGEVRRMCRLTSLFSPNATEKFPLRVCAR